MRSMISTGLVSVYSFHDRGGIVKSRLKSGTYSKDHLKCLLFFRPLCDLRMSKWRSLIAAFRDLSFIKSRGGGGGFSLPETFSS